MADSEDQNDDAQASTDKLNDVFDSDDTDDAAAGEPAKAEDEEAPKGDAKAVKAEEAEPPAAEDEDEEEEDEAVVPVAALKAERSKRQAAEAELDKLKKQPSGENQEDQGEPDLEQILFAERSNMSREMMIDSKSDYEEMEKVFTELAKDDPNLVRQMVKSPNPAKFAYNKAKEHQELEELKKAKSSPEWEQFQKWKANKDKPVEETPKVKGKKSALDVPDLNKVPSAASNSTPKEKLESLNEMFED